MNGIELIAKERGEQIEKHRYTSENDAKYKSNELLNFAVSVLIMDEDYFPFKLAIFENVMNKSRVDQLAIAGALIAAEIDRIKSNV